MEDKLYFLDLGKEPNHLTPCKYLMENEGYYYFHDVSKSALEGVIAVPEGKLSEISRELRTIAPTPQLLACLGEYGVGDQKRVSIAVPDEQCIFTGYVDKDDEGYHVNYDILGQHRRMDMRQFGRDFCAVPLGRQVYPWTYSMFDPLSHGRNTEYGFLVNARTKGLRCFLNHPDIQFVLKLDPTHVLSILRHAASLVFDGYIFKPGTIPPFTYMGRQFQVMEAASSDTDDTVVYRLLLADPNGKFPGDDDEVTPEYEAQNVSTDDIMGE